MNRDPAQAEVRAAQRGIVFLTLAKAYFMVAGAAIEFGLPRLIAASSYGFYRLVSSVVSPLNNVVVTGTIQAVSRFTVQGGSAPGEVQRTGFRMHVLLGLPITVFFAALAPAWAWFYDDPAKAGPIALAAGIVACYAMYAVLVGRANGERRFSVQAGLDVGFASARALLILGMAAAGLGIYGIFSGWIAAALLILCVAAVVVGMPKAKQQPPQPLRPLLSFFASVFLYLFLINVIMVIDTHLLKYFVGRWYSDHQAGLVAFADTQSAAWVGESVGKIASAVAADVQVGFYGAVQNLARLTYQAIIAVTFVIFPLISRTTFHADAEATRAYISATARYSLIVATACAAVFASNAEDIFGLAFPGAFAQAGADALMPLAFGYLGFSILVIAGTILNGAGYTRLAIASGSVTLVVAAVGNVIALSGAAPGPQLLRTAAFATGGAMLLGAVFSLFMVHRVFGASVTWRTLLRLLVAVAVMFPAARLWNSTGLFVVVEMILIGLLYLVVLVVTRELTRADAAVLMSPLRRS